MLLIHPQFSDFAIMTKITEWKEEYKYADLNMRWIWDEYEMNMRWIWDGQQVCNKALQKNMAKKYTFWPKCKAFIQFPHLINICSVVRGWKTETPQSTLPAIVFVSYNTMDRYKDRWRWSYVSAVVFGLRLCWDIVVRSLWLRSGRGVVGNVECFTDHSR